MKRRRDYFFSSVTGILGKLFRQGNKPDEKAFKDLTDSVLFKEEVSDTANDDIPGHVLSAMPDNLRERTKKRDGHSLFVGPHQLPQIIKEDTDCYDHNGIKQGQVGYDPMIIEGQGINIKVVFRPPNMETVYVIGTKLSDNMRYEDDAIAIDKIDNTNFNDHSIMPLLLALEKSEIAVAGGVAKLENNGSILIGNEDEETGLKVVNLNGDVTMNEDGKITISDKAVTLDTMDDIPKGYALIGGDGNRPFKKDLRLSGGVLIGQGNDVEVKQLSGDISLDENGNTLIENNTIKLDHLQNIFGSTLEVSDELLEVNYGYGLEKGNNGELRVSGSAFSNIIGTLGLSNVIRVNPLIEEDIISELLFKSYESAGEYIRNVIVPGEDNQVTVLIGNGYIDEDIIIEEYVHVLGLGGTKIKKVGSNSDSSCTNSINNVVIENLRMLGAKCLDINNCLVVNISVEGKGVPIIRINNTKVIGSYEDLYLYSLKNPSLNNYYEMHETSGIPEIVSKSIIEFISDVYENHFESYDTEIKIDNLYFYQHSVVKLIGSNIDIDNFLQTQGTSELFIINSYVKGNINAKENSTITIINSVIDGDIMVDDNGSISLLRGTLVLGDKTIEGDGTITDEWEN